MTRKTYQESCREKGKKGGKATGACKRRSPEHYRKMAEAKRKKREETKHAREIGEIPPID